VLLAIIPSELSTVTLALPDTAPLTAVVTSFNSTEALSIVYLAPVIVLEASDPPNVNVNVLPATTVCVLDKQSFALH
jgi:hypothetical protein